MNEDLPYQKTMLDYAAADTSGHEFKNAFAFLLRDARHAMHDILLLRIYAIPPEAVLDGGLTPTTDTAWAYAGSEDAIRQALVERYPRESFKFATKNAAWINCKTKEDAIRTV